MYTLNLCLDDVLKLEQFKAKNGKKYVNLSMFLNEKADNYGNIIQLKGKVNNEFIFVGNGKEFVKKQNNEKSDLPF